MNEDQKSSTTPKDQKESSYHYWVKDDVEFYKGVEKPSTVPKPIDPKEARQKIKSTQGSAWNKVGTWEEKHFDVADLVEYLSSAEITFGDGYRVSKIKNLTGNISCVMVRGKRKAGYELNFEVEVERGTQFITIKFDEFNEYGDHEYNICVGTISKSEMEDVFDDLSAAFANNVEDFVDIFANN